MHCPDEFGNQDGRRNRSGSDRNAVEVAAPEQVEIEFEALVLEIERSCVPEDRLSGSRQRDAVHVAVKQLHAQVVFNRLNAATERRGAEMNAHRRSGNAPFLSQRDEVD